MKNIIADKVARILLSQNRSSLPINPMALNYKKKIHFDTVQNYLRTTPNTSEVLADFEALRDGITIKYDGVFLVLINAEITSQSRKNFTVAHEIGHILLDHENDYQNNEKQADYFAAELLMPRVLIKSLFDGHGICDVEKFNEYFKVSFSAMKLRYYECGKDFVISEQEKALYERYKALLPVLGSPIVDFN